MKRVGYGLLVFLGCYLLVTGCVQPLDLPETGVKRSLVVDGLLTQEDVVVRLYETPASVLQPLMPLTNAAVTVFSTAGEVVQLELQPDGSYRAEPNSWIGEFGETYWLRVDIAEGRVYESEKQILTNAGWLDRGSVEFKPFYSLNTPNQPPHVIEVQVTSRKTTSQQLLRWRWSGTYQVLTYPEKIPVVVNMSGMIVLQPPPCATSSVCTCCTCWVTETNPTVLLSASTTSAAEAEVKTVAYLPVDAHRFSERYRMEIEQLSLDANSYRFWQQVDAQTQATTNLFQPAVLRLQGNIRNMNNPDEVVLGVFSVAGVTRTVLDIDRDQVPRPFWKREELLEDCRSAFRNSKNIKPLFW